MRVSVAYNRVLQADVKALIKEKTVLERENAALRTERDSYRFRSEQIWGLRKEIQASLGVPSECEGEEALQQGLAAIQTLRADRDRLDSGRIMLRVYDSMDGWKTCEFVGQNLRTAIDAARKEAQP